MNKIKLAGIAIIVVLFVLNSCSNDPLGVGLELLPVSDLLNANADTLKIDGFTVKGNIDGFTVRGYSNFANSSVETSSKTFPYGTVTDPVFGESQADLALQFNYSSESHYTFDKNAVSDKIESCKLYFHIDNEKTYGGEKGFNAIAYPLTQRINFYYSTAYIMKSEDFDASVNLAKSTEHNSLAEDNDLPDIDSNNYYLVVELDTSYFSFLMDTTFINENKVYTTQLNFVKQFPGLYLRSEAITPVGGIENIMSSSSLILLEYKRTYKDGSGNDSIVKKYNSLPLKQYLCMYNNESNRSPKGPFGNFLGDTVTIQDNLYIQSLGGIRGYVHISDFDAFREINSDKIGVNYAELVFPVNQEYADTTNFYLPERIALREYNRALGAPYYIVDEAPNYSLGYFSGYLDKKNMEYRINITEYAHRYMLGGTSTGWLYVLPSLYELNSYSVENFYTPGRAVLNTGNSTNPAYMRIIYTNIN
jgi:hypothetical protein